MALDTDAIEDAIFAEMEADTDLVAVLGGTPGRMYPEEAPESPTSPYVVYTLITGIPDPTFTSDGEILNYQFTVFNIRGCFHILECKYYFSRLNENLIKMDIQIMKFIT